MEDYNDKEHKRLNYIHNLKSFTHLLSNKFIPVKVDNLKKSGCISILSFYFIKISQANFNLGSKIMPEHIGNALLPRSIVYMTSFASLNEIYIRKLEDYNDEFETFLNMVNAFCLSGKYI